MLNLFKTDNYRDISKYRQELFGIAIIIIVIFHYTSDASRIDNNYRIAQLFCQYWLKLFSSIGVDIFVFLSGMGVYHSMIYNSNVKTFYLKRFRKVLIPYALIGGIFWFVKDLFLSKTGWLSFLYDVSFLSFWMDGTRILWYIAFIISAYLFFPAMFFLSEIQPRFRNAIILGIMLITCGLSIIYGIFFPHSLSNIEIALGRFMGFEFGFFLGRSIKDGKKIKAIHIIYYIVCMYLCGVLQSIFKEEALIRLIERWRITFYALLLILIICLFFNRLHGCPNLSRILSWFGCYTLEIYLLHVTIREILNYFGWNTGYIKYYCIVILLTLVFLPVVLFFEKKMERILAIIVL